MTMKIPKLKTAGFIWVELGKFYSMMNRTLDKPCDESSLTFYSTDKLYGFFTGILSVENIKSLKILLIHKPPWPFIYKVWFILYDFLTTGKINHFYENLEFLWGWNFYGHFDLFKNFSKFFILEANPENALTFTNFDQTLKRQPIPYFNVFSISLFK